MNEIHHDDAQFARCLWKAADALGEAMAAIDRRSRDLGWVRKHGDLADLIIDQYDDMRHALRGLALKHHRTVMLDNEGGER